MYMESLQKHGSNKETAGAYCFTAKEILRKHNVIKYMKMGILILHT